MKINQLNIAVLLLTATMFTNCKKKEVEPVSVDVASVKANVVKNYASNVYANYQDTYDKAVALKTKISVLVATPSANTLAEAKQAWLDARIPYLQTEAYRFYGGPIDDEDGPEGLLNAWPMDEAYVDYVQGDSVSGIINKLSIYPTIDKALIESLNEAGGETNIATGYHAIEFLLWGQDLNNAGAGNRSYKDFLSTGGTANNQVRRGQYLLATADLLVDNLADLVNEWAPNATNYRATFEAAPVNESLQKMLLGMGSLAGGELSGERMKVAYDTQLQEDEHSCFSDNTHNDIVFDAKGIANVYYGKYIKSDGTVLDGVGIDELLALSNATLNNEIKARLTTTQTSAEAIQAPFDQEIINTNGRARILTTIESLEAEANKIVEAAKALGITLVL